MFDQLNSLEDIDGLITSGIRESETLEYKQGSVRLVARDHAEVAKDVSAFANSSGGLLIYGVATDSSDRTKPLQRVQILPANIDVILQVISTHIRQPIPGLRYKTLPMGSSPEVFLIDVPQSDLAPHQVATQDYRYYRRQGPQSMPMSHDLVELYFSRRAAAVLEPLVSMKDLSQPPPLGGGWLLEFRVELENHGKRLGKFAMLQISADTGGPVRQLRTISRESQVFPRQEGTRKIYRYPMPVDEVFYPGVPLHIVTFDVIVPEQTFGTDHPLFDLEVFAEDMRARRYRLHLTRERNIDFSLEPVLTLLDRVD